MLQSDPKPVYKRLCTKKWKSTWGQDSGFWSRAEQNFHQMNKPTLLDFKVMGGLFFPPFFFVFGVLDNLCISLSSLSKLCSCFPSRKEMTEWYEHLPQHFGKVYSCFLFSMVFKVTHSPHVGLDKSSCYVTVMVVESALRSACDLSWAKTSFTFWLISLSF